MELQAGLKGQSTLTVTEAMLASHVGSGLVSVFSTAMMIAHMEATAVAVAQQCLPPEMTTVGTHVDIAHLAATPCGMEVRFEAELLEVSPNGKGLTFHVAAYDACGLIGEGRHERVVVHKATFEGRTAAKGQNH